MLWRLLRGAANMFRLLVLYVFLIPQPQETAWGGVVGGVHILLSQCICASQSPSGSSEVSRFQDTSQLLNHNFFFSYVAFYGPERLEYDRNNEVVNNWGWKRSLLKVTDFPLQNGKDSLTDFSRKSTFIFSLWCVPCMFRYCSVDRSHQWKGLALWDIKIKQVFKRWVELIQFVLKLTLPTLCICQHLHVFRAPFKQRDFWL